MKNCLFFFFMIFSLTIALSDSSFGMNPLHQTHCKQSNEQEVKKELLGLKRHIENVLVKPIPTIASLLALDTFAKGKQLPQIIIDGAVASSHGLTFNEKVQFLKTNIDQSSLPTDNTLCKCLALDMNRITIEMLQTIGARTPIAICSAVNINYIKKFNLALKDVLTENKPTRKNTKLIKTIITSYFPSCHKKVCPHAEEQSQRIVLLNFYEQTVLLKNEQ